jgi:tight adherence protein B
LNSAPLLLLAAALLLALGAWLLWQAGSRGEQRSVLRSRLEFMGGRPARELERRSGKRRGLARFLFVSSRMYRAGLTLSSQAQSVLIAAPLAVFPLIAMALGLPGAVVSLALYLALLYLLLVWKIGRFGNALVEQLPGFLDSVSRSLAVGNTMTVAIHLAIEKSPDPVKRVFDQVLRRHEMGASIEDALEQVARSYQIRELSMLASVVSVNSRFGGKVEPVLNNISNAIREAQRARRELFALTAETRFSAWLLSAMPLGVGLMMLMSNPAYLRGMWQDETGHLLLLGAFGLEACGALLLFRLSKV